MAMYTRRKTNQQKTIDKKLIWREFSLFPLIDYCYCLWKMINCGDHNPTELTKSDRFEVIK